MTGTFLSTAPGRTSIIGNPSDIYGGSVISCATRERAATLIEPAEQLSFEVAGRKSVVTDPEGLKTDGGLSDVAKAVISFLHLGSPRFSLKWSCDIPFSAGLAGSSAMVVAIMNAILAFVGRSEDAFMRAEMSRHAELEHLVFCGYQDAYMCTFGGLHYMDFREKAAFSPFGEDPFGTMEPLHAHVKRHPYVVAHTGTQRDSGSVHSPIRDRWLRGERKVLDGYNRIARIARDGKRALLREDWEALGELMQENHEIQSGLGGTGAEVNGLIDAALDAGALGAKLAGAGHGGAIVALTLNPEPVISALREAGASRILIPEPGPGVTVTPITTQRQRDSAEQALLGGSAKQDVADSG